MTKFSKNREVDDKYLNVPVKYILEAKGSDTMSKGHYEQDKVSPEQYEKYLELHNAYLSDEAPLTFEEFAEEGAEKVWVPSKHDKTLCIVELHKREAVCAWRNNSTYKMGRTFLCKIEKHNGHMCIIYKDKPYRLDTPYGWVF